MFEALLDCVGHLGGDALLLVTSYSLPALGRGLRVEFPHEGASAPHLRMNAIYVFQSEEEITK